MRPLLLALLLAACGTDNTLRPPVDAQGDVPGLEVAVDVSPAADVDAPGVDAPGPEAPPADVAAVGDAPEDAAFDAPVPDAEPDVAAVVDAVVDASPEVLSDAPADADPLEQRVTTLSVVVRSGETTWTMPRTPTTQMCTITGTTVSVGVEYERPSRNGFVAAGPLSGPVLLGTTFESDVRATIRHGSEYYTAGSVRRLNIHMTGTLPSGPMLSMTVMGCQFR